VSVTIDLDREDIPRQLAGLSPVSPGEAVVRTGTITLDSSYPTGGEALAAAAFGIDNIDFVSFGGAGGYVLEYDYANAKVMAWYGDFNAVADGALIEVPNTTDLSTVSAHFVLVGRVGRNHDLP